MMMIKGVTDVTLYNVGRKDKTDNEIDEMDDLDKLVYQASLSGSAFQKDNKKFYAILKQSLTNTDGWKWILNYDLAKHGRKSIIFLRTSYDGHEARLKRLADANQSTQNLHYSQEQTFPFKCFITLLQETFKIPEDNQEARSKEKSIGSCYKRFQLTMYKSSQLFQP